ncbi:MAG: hypothetical protein LUD72_01010 [Bacteroidales bacterium]|nr:hypothetical protein [Bacteroidales bacterium]
MAIVSCLETRSRSERTDELVRNYYTDQNPYSVTHPNAKADGDTKGKGVGVGNPNPLPNCNSYGTIGYYNFITGIESGAGCSYDVSQRENSLVRQLYGPQNPYDRVDTSANQKEGQYVVG